MYEAYCGNVSAEFGARKPWSIRTPFGSGVAGADIYESASGAQSPPPQRSATAPPGASAEMTASAALMSGCG